jgi:hypothetical protein
MIMRIRNNNDFVLLLTLILGVLVVFYSRIYLGEYVYPSPDLQPYSEVASVGELIRVLGLWLS